MIHAVDAHFAAGEEAGSSSKAAPSTGSALADLMRRRLRQLHVTQAEVARRAGMPRAYLYRLCQGGVPNPGVLTLGRLAQALQLPTAALVRLWLDTGACPRSQHLSFEAVDNPADRLMFLDDVTVPDHALVMPGERFTKTWAIQNVGETRWPVRRLVRRDAELVVARRERSGALTPLLDAYLNSLERSVEVPSTPPGAVVEVSVDFAAPLENCTVASVWRLETPQGQPCYKDRCFLQVIVTVQGG